MNRFLPLDGFYLKFLTVSENISTMPQTNQKRSHNKLNEPLFQNFAIYIRGSSITVIPFFSSEQIYEKHLRHHVNDTIRKETLMRTPLHPLDQK